MPLIVPGYRQEQVRNDPIRTNTVFVLKPYAYVPDQCVYNVTWGDSVVVREDSAQRLGTRPYVIEEGR